MGPSSFNDGDEQEVVELVVSVDASMGPSSFNDGDTPDSACTIRPDSGFNGAVVFQRRRCEIATRKTTETVAASMGPSSFNDGDWSIMATQNG